MQYTIDDSESSVSVATGCGDVLLHLSAEKIEKWTYDTRRP
jgi:hypothetical protein